jgi:hypothetical protein
MLLLAAVACAGDAGKTPTAPATDDLDGDGYTPAEGDCLDLAPGTPVPADWLAVDGTAPDPAAVHPGATDAWYDGIDQDCAGDDDFDADGDGSASSEHPRRTGALGEDCDDADPARNPAATERCNGVDDDCDGATDDEDDSLSEDGATTFYADADGDGHGDPETSQWACAAPGPTWVATAEDCDDTDPAIAPGAPELCDGRDNDCDALVDDDDPDRSEDDAATWYADRDGDGFGAPDDTTRACSAPADHVALAGDCDDTDAETSPLAYEVCNDGVDNDCDGTLGTREVGGACALRDSSLDEAQLVLLGVTRADTAGERVRFGGDIGGDGIADLLVAAPYEDGTASGAGAVYVVSGGPLDPDDHEVRSLSTATATLRGAALADHAGTGLAGEDADADGYADLAIGAPHADDAGSGSGGAYLFFGPVTGERTVEEADVALIGGGAREYTGWSTHIGGDIDGSGAAAWLVGAPAHPDASGSATAQDATTGGALLVFRGGSLRTGGGTPNQRIEGAGVGDALGMDVITGDLDGDGVHEILAGAPGADGGAGAVLAFAYAAGDTAATDALATWSGVAAGDAAGSALAVADLDGDGTDDLVIGAPKADTGALDSGAAYVVQGTRGGSLAALGTVAHARIDGVRRSDWLASSLAAAGDQDADGIGDLLVGVPRTDDAGTNSGEVRLFLGPVSGLLGVTDAAVTLASPNAGDQAGASVHGGQDFDGDGLPDIVVGARLQDDGDVNAGAASLFLGLGL